MAWERERPSSFARALFLSIAFRRPDARSAIQIVRPLESIAGTRPQLPTGL